MCLAKVDKVYPVALEKTMFGYKVFSPCEDYNLGIKNIFYSHDIRIDNVNYDYSNVVILTENNERYFSGFHIYDLEYEKYIKKNKNLGYIVYKVSFTKIVTEGIQHIYNLCELVNIKCYVARQYNLIKRM